MHINQKLHQATEGNNRIRKLSGCDRSGKRKKKFTNRDCRREFFLCVTHAMIGELDFFLLAIFPMEPTIFLHVMREDWIAPFADAPARPVLELRKYIYWAIYIYMWVYINMYARFYERTRALQGLSVGWLIGSLVDQWVGKILLFEKTENTICVIKTTGNG